MNENVDDLDVSMNLDDPEPKIQLIKIGGKRFFLREADEDAACKYRNAIMRSHKFDSTGKPTGIDGLADAAPLLVSRCLYYPDKEGNPPILPNGMMNQKALVPQSKIMFWSSRITKPLFERIKEISDLGETGTDTPGKALINALSLPDAPISLKDFREWVNNLEGDEYNSLKELVRYTEEEKAKNLQESTTSNSA